MNRVSYALPPGKSACSAKPHMTVAIRHRCGSLCHRPSSQTRIASGGWGVRALNPAEPPRAGDDGATGKRPQNVYGLLACLLPSNASRRQRSVCALPS